MRKYIFNEIDVLEFVESVISDINKTAYLDSNVYEINDKYYLTVSLGCSINLTHDYNISILLDYVDTDYQEVQLYNNNIDICKISLTDEDDVLSLTDYESYKDDIEKVADMIYEALETIRYINK